MKQLNQLKNIIISFINLVLDKRNSSILLRKTCLKNKELLFSVIFLGIIQSFIEGANIYFIYLIVSLITGSDSTQITFINKITEYFNKEDLFFSVSLVLILLISVQLIQSIVKYFFILKTENFTINIKNYIRQNIYERIFKFDYQTSSSIKIGRLLNLTIQVPEAIRERIEILSNLIVSIALLFSYLFILIKISSLLLFVILIFQFLVLYLQVLPRKFLKNTSRRLNLSEEKINNQLSEEINSLKYLYSTGSVKEPIFNLKNKLENNHFLTMKLASIRSALMPSSQFVGIIILSIITLSSLYLFNLNGILQPEKIVIFLFTLNRLNGKTSQIAENISVLAVNRGILSSLDLFLDDSDKTFRIQNEGITKFQKGPCSIKLAGINYKYPGSKTYALEDINLEIRSGEYIAIIGESGSGKTTLLDIVLKLMKPSEGKIFINNHNLQNINSISWQNSIGYVGQQNFIYSGSIYENIHMNTENIDLKQVKKCINAVGLNDFINSLSEKGNTKIGEGYRKISGGQMQKINIARALYRKPSLLILDEATSNQDLENENLITELINNLSGSTTIIVVAHRLNSITKADKIFMLKNGKVIESGDHNNLIRKGKYYFNLWQNYKSNVNNIIKE